MKNATVIRSTVKFALLILTTSMLAGCYDSMSLDDPNRSVNRSYGFYQFYDSPDSYYSSPAARYYSYGNSLPSRGNYYNNQQIQQVQQVQQVQHHHLNQYYNQPAPNAQHQNNYQQHFPQNNNQNAQQQAIQQQIDSDRALAQRLQNEEVAQAQKEAQIRSDRALAERLQAAEYAQIQ